MGLLEDGLIGKRVFVVTLFFILLGSTLGYIIYQNILDAADVKEIMMRMVEFLGMIMIFYVGSHNKNETGA